MKLTEFFAPALLAFALPAAATTVYDNGPLLSTTDGGNEATAWVQAEDFSFASSTSLGGAGVYIASQATIGAYDGNLQYYIFANNSGTPGSVLATGSVTPTAVDTGKATSFGSNVYLLSFNFASDFNAIGGTGYYFGFHASGAGDFSRDDVYWAVINPNATGLGQESVNGTSDNWSGNGSEHAFFLTDGTTVPEPASWALMIGGFAMTGVAMRRRKGAVAA